MPTCHNQFATYSNLKVAIKEAAFAYRSSHLAVYNAAKQQTFKRIAYINEIIHLIESYTPEASKRYILLMGWIINSYNEASQFNGNQQDILDLLRPFLTNITDFEKYLAPYAIFKKRNRIYLSELLLHDFDRYIIRQFNNALEKARKFARETDCIFKKEFIALYQLAEFCLFSCDDQNIIMREIFTYALHECILFQKHNMHEPSQERFAKALFAIEAAIVNNDNERLNKLLINIFVISLVTIGSCITLTLSSYSIAPAIVLGLLFATAYTSIDGMCTLVKQSRLHKAKNKIIFFTNSGNNHEPITEMQATLQTSFNP